MTLPPDYQAALDTIFNYVDYERRRSVPYDEVAWNLDRTRRVLAALGNPHRNLRFVHVAGSKGKGSTAAMIEAVLRASGLRTGLYTSPHLHTFRERIRVDGQLLSRGRLVALLDQCRPAIEAVPGITTFEIITVLALLHFAQQGVDWGVLEVGLGGRLDATNVVTPKLSVITAIGHEHTALLGDTLAQIAQEKAGIVKPGVPVVCAPQEVDALAAISQTCQRQNACLILIGRDWHWRPVEASLDGQSFDVTCTRGSIRPAARGEVDAVPGFPFCYLPRLRIPHLGRFQLVNAATAVAAAAELARAGAAIDEDSVRRGLASVYWPARLEVLQRPAATKPAVVVDCAHTRESARLLHEALTTYFPAARLRLVFGVSRDKDVAAILNELTPAVESIIVTRSRHPRAAEPGHLANQTSQHYPAERISVAGTVLEAMSAALSQAAPGEVVCVAGSLFMAAEAREAWLTLHPGVLPSHDWAYDAEPPDPTWQVAQQVAR